VTAQINATSATVLAGRLERGNRHQEASPLTREATFLQPYYAGGERRFKDEPVVCVVRSRFNFAEASP